MDMDMRSAEAGCGQRAFPRLQLFLRTSLLDSSLQSAVCRLDVARAQVLILILTLLEGWTLFLPAVQDRVPTGR